MPKCLLCDSTRDYKVLYPHLRKIHKITVDEYLAKFPTAELASEEVRRKWSESASNSWKDGKMDTPSKRLQAENFSRCGVEYKQSEQGRQFQSSLMKDRWKDEVYRKIYSDASKKRWEDETYKNSVIKKIIESSGVGMTSIHRMVSDYLTSINIDHVNEKPLNGVCVDIYIPSIDKIIECNGEHWHGNPEVMAIEDMTGYQLKGYNRDCKRKELFGDRVLFLWESEIYDGSYKDKLLNFIKLI